jgi:hypothetical protein
MLRICDAAQQIAPMSLTRLSVQIALSERRKTVKN